MAAGGGKPRWGVDICWEMCCKVDFEAGSGGRDLLAGMGGSEGPGVATTGEKREVDGGVGGV